MDVKVTVIARVLALIHDVRDVLGSTFINNIT